MKTSGLRASADTHPGLQRDVNEDRVHVDVERGLFMVIDGVGGHFAGGKAADVALSILRERLERESDLTADHVRKAIAAANNEIHRLAALRPEWRGMACVLTLAVARNGRAIVGHVGDTRLYKIHEGRIGKVTRDHSPVGELEDAHMLSEEEAMRHPRRNEIYRDVGSDRHDGDEADFVELQDIPLERDAALLLCSDGLTDLVSLGPIADIISRNVGHVDGAVRELVEAANAAGGRDNVSVVYVEGERFAERHASQPIGPEATAIRGADESEVITARLSDTRQPADMMPPPIADPPPDTPSVVTAPVWRPVIVGALLVALAAISVWQQPVVPAAPPAATSSSPEVVPLVVQPSQSIMAALERAVGGSTVIVEPGEYREQIRLKSGVRLISRVSRAATIRLPAAASEGEAAVIAVGITGAELTGFRIVGDAATPLGTGIIVGDASVAIVDVEIVGATNNAIDFWAKADASLIGSSVHDNPGAALALRPEASPRISHNTFFENGSSRHVGGAFLVSKGAQPRLYGNVFVGAAADAFHVLDDGARAALTRDNWFLARRPGGQR